MAAHALPGLRSRLRDYVPHCIYCPVAAHALPGLRSGSGIMYHTAYIARWRLAPYRAYGPGSGIMYRTAYIARWRLAPYRAYGPGSGIMYRTAYIARWRLAPYRAYGMNVSLDSVGRVRREPSPGVLFALSGVKIGNVPSPIRRIQPEAHITMKS